MASGAEAECVCGRRNVQLDVIECARCLKWFHPKCANLPLVNYYAHYLKLKNAPYMCPGCSALPIGERWLQAEATRSPAPLFLRDGPLVWAKAQGYPW
eukprot:9493709-Pyramimonas_sp.AAC.1